MDKGKVAQLLAQKMNVQLYSTCGQSLTRCDIGHDFGPALGGLMPGLMGDKGIDAFQPPASQHILDPGKAMGMGADMGHELRQTVVFLGPDRHRDMAAFAGRHDTAPRGFMHGGGIHPGAKAYDQHRRAGF